MTLSRRPRWVSSLVVLAVVLAGCGGGAAGSSSQTTPQRPSTSVQGTIETLASAGVSTVAQETSTSPLAGVTGATVFTVTRWQASNMAVEASSHGGISGADLDATLPMPASAPQFADILGGWVLTKGDADAVAAGQLLGNQGWADPEAVIFPTEVLTLFVADALQHAEGSGASTSASTGAAWEDPRPSGSGFVAQDASIVTAPCTTVTSFVDNVLDQVFGILKVNADEVGKYVSGALGGGFLGSVVGGLFSWGASIWNHAVDLAEQAAKNILKGLSQPILNAMALVIGGAAVITMIRSYLKQWSAPIVPEPGANAFAVGGSVGNPGGFTVEINTDAETTDWPPQMVDCASAAHVTLPTLSTSGAPVTWTVQPGVPALVTPGELTGALDKDLHETLTYRTGVEDPKLAHTGMQISPAVTVGVRVRRTEVEELRKFVTSYLTGRVPDLVAPILSPILAAYVERATQYLDKITAIQGWSTIVVTHHVPKPPPAPVSCGSSSTTTSGTTIPAGSYAGTINATVKTKMTLTLPSGTIPNAGSGTLPMHGRVTLTSDGRQVTGTITMAGKGLSQVGLPGSVQVHSNDSGSLRGTISGPASSPVVTGSLHGAWASFDAPVINGKGSATNHIRAGLHVISASCAAISGDAVAMFAEFAKPVAQYISISGSGVWTAART